MDKERPGNAATGEQFDLPRWSPEARESLEFLIADAGIPFQWQGSALTVPARHHEEVASFIAYLQGERTRLPDAPVQQLRSPSHEAGWYSRSDRENGWGWWDGTAWADHGGDAPPADYSWEPGWYPDPWKASPDRWWDGYSWTGYAADRGADRPWFPTAHEPEDALAVRGIGLVIAGIIAAEVVAVALSLALYLAGFGRSSLWLETIPTIGLWTVLFGTCVLAVRRHGHGSLAEIGLERLRGNDFSVGLLGAYIGRTAVGCVALVFVPFLPDKLVRDTSFLNDLRGNAAVLVVVGAIIVVGAPFFEELFFRGLAQAACTRRWGARGGIFAQAGLFAIVHYQVGMGLAEALLTLATIGTFGIILGVLRAHYQRLGPGMVAHSVFNLVAVLFALSLR